MHKLDTVANCEAMFRSIPFHTMLKRNKDLYFFSGNLEIPCESNDGYAKNGY